MTNIKRRTVLKAMGGLSLGTLIPAVGESSVRDKNHHENLQTIKTDILVVGGGTAGVIAAIQAARAGCSTVLVENGSQLGGTTTTGGVSFPGLFHAWGKQIIRGIGWELVTDTVKMDDGMLPDFTIPTGMQHWKHQIRINGNLYALLIEESCLKAGVMLRYYETPVSVSLTGNAWEVETVGKGCHTRIVCNQLVDCTGNAAVTAMAGFKVLREKEIQPGTLMFRIGGYDPDELDLQLIGEKYEEAVAKGELVGEEFRSIQSLLKTRGENIQHIAGADSTTSETHTLTNINGRSSLLKHLKFLRTLPGCEKIKLISMQPETGVRETYRIDGNYQITHEDYVSGKIFNDSVCYSFYPIDLHDKNGVLPQHLEAGKVATIPLRALIPRKSRNLIVAGRCVSSDRLANSALSVQASCMAMGQASGAAAALAHKLNTTPQEVPFRELRSLLNSSGAIVPE